MPLVPRGAMIQPLEREELAHGGQRRAVGRRDPNLRSPRPVHRPVGDVRPPGAHHAGARHLSRWTRPGAAKSPRAKADPGEYAKLVAAGEKGITKVDDKADIVLGGMYGYPRDSASMKAEKYLSKLYETKGFAKSFDALNSHPYGPDVGAVKKQIGELRGVAKRNGDGNVDLYVGELGWASSGPKKSESVVGRKGQAKRLEDGLKLLAKKRNAWNVVGVAVYTWKDFPAGQLACQWCPGAGLLEENGDPKPALKAVKRVIK